MAQRRMFSPDIVDSDAFLDMPQSSQLLYFHLAMRADDDGFVNPKKIMRMIGTGDDDLKVLLAKRFLLPFQSGVVVIKHWLIHNMIRKDRYKETQYLEEKRSLKLKENGAYTEVATIGQPDGNQPATQVRLGKVRLGKDSTLSAQSADAERADEPKPAKETFEVFWTAYPRKTAKAEALKSWSKLRPDVRLLSAILTALGLQKQSSQWRRDAGQYIPHPATWLNQRRWEDETSSTITKINSYG